MANYRKLARRDARRFGLAPDIFLRQINQESGFNPGAVSPAGARGIAQFMPGTARGLGVNPDNPVQALEAAARLMAGYVKKYGSYRDALVAYNAGPGRVGGKLPAETQAYVQAILSGRNPAAGGANPGTPGYSVTTTTTGLDPAALQQRRSALAQFVLGSSEDPVKLAQYVASTPTVSSSSTKHYPGTPATSPGSSSPSAQGVAKFDGKPVAGWIAPILQYARQHGWKGSVTSGYRSYADQQRIYNSGVRPAAKPGTSNHEMTAFPGGAVDVTDPQTLARILARSPFAGKLVYAGSKDPVHFSHPHNGGY